MKPWWVLPLVVVFGCDRSRAGRPSPADCKQQTAELARYLATVPPSDDTLDVGSVQLVARADLPKRAPEPAPQVRLVGTRLELDGKAVQPSELREKLGELSDQFATLHPGREFPATVNLVIDGSVTWDRITETVLSAFSVGFDTARVVFAAPMQSTPPPRAAIDDELDRMPTTQPARAEQLARLLTEASKRCPELGHAFGQLEGKRAAIEDVVPAAIHQCECSVDIPTIRSLLWRTLASPRALSFVEVAVDRNVAAIVLPGSTTWSEASKRFTATTTSVWLAVEGDYAGDVRELEDATRK